MSYYPLCSLDGALKCTFCTDRFDDDGDVKLVPDCGNSICDRCHRGLLAALVGTFQCKACHGCHSISARGFATNQLLAKMLRLEPAEEQVLPEEAVAAAAAATLLSIVGGLRERIEGLVRTRRTEQVSAHCDQLKAAVLEAMEEKLALVRRAADEHLSLIEDYRRRLVDSISADFSDQLETNSALKRELNQVREDFERFNRKWTEFLSGPIDEADLDRARDEAKSYESRIGGLECQVHAEFPKNSLLHWRPNTSFSFHRKQLGELTLQSRFLCDQYETDESLSQQEGKRITPLLRCVPEAINDFLALPDGRLVCCYANQTIKVVDGACGCSFFSLKVPGTVAITLSLLRKDCLRWLAAGCRDGSIQIWDLINRSLTRVLKGHRAAVFSLRRLPDGQLASISWDNTIKVWSPLGDDAGLRVSMQGHETRWDALDLGLLSTGHLVTCSNSEDQNDDCVIRVWDPRAGLLVRTCHMSLGGASSLLVLADDRLVIGFGNGTLRLLDLQQESAMVKLPIWLGSKVLSTLQLPNGHLVGCGTLNDRFVRSWDLESGLLVNELDTGRPVNIRALRLSPNGRLLYILMADYQINSFLISNSPIRVQS